MLLHLVECAKIELGGQYKYDKCIEMAIVGRFIAINSEHVLSSSCINDEILIPQAEFGKVVRDADGRGGALLARVTNVETGVWRICCIGGIHCEGSMHCIIPEWLIENLGVFSFESWIEVEMLSPDEQPVTAEKIVFRLMDNAEFYGDIRERFEVGLDMWHVIQEGSIIEIEIGELDGIKIKALVEAVEPDPIGRLGGEVEVEFLKPDNDDNDVVLNNAIAASIASADAHSVPLQQLNQSFTELSAQERRELVRQAWINKISNQSKQ
jgi:hypothetical protein